MRLEYSINWEAEADPKVLYL